MNHSIAFPEIQTNNQTKNQMKNSTYKPEQPALYVTTKDEPDYQGGRDLTIDIAFCVTPDEEGKRYPRGGSQPLQGLHFIIRGGSTALRYSEGKDAFHTSVSICFNDLYFAQIAEMESKTKAMRAVHRKMDAMREKLGYATTPIELVGRFAEAVGAVGVYFVNDREREMTSGEKFGFYDRARGLDQIRYTARQMAEKLTTETAVSA